LNEEMTGMFGFGSGAKVKTLTPHEVKNLVDSGAVRLVDVREDNEWAQARIPGAVHVALSRLPTDAERLPKDKPVVFYCAGGVRSAKAVAVVARLGLNHDSHLGGGISAWANAGLPIER
jgi:rhodanese-related sulfurtransferase